MKQLTGFLLGVLIAVGGFACLAGVMLCVAYRPNWTPMVLLGVGAVILFGVLDKIMAERPAPTPPRTTPKKPMSIEDAARMAPAGVMTDEEAREAFPVIYGEKVEPQPEPSWFNRYNPN